MAGEPVMVRPLRPELLSDFLDFFDGDAFADNPRWRFCYCQYLHTDHSKVDWNRRTVEENRCSASARIRAGSMLGYLAYRGGRPVGWCNAAPRSLMAALPDAPGPDSRSVGTIGCFVVAKPHRRSGVASALLEAACSGFVARGLTVAEAMPQGSAASDAANHSGPLALYLAAGFRVHWKGKDGTVCVRRRLVERP